MDNMNKWMRVGAHLFRMDSIAYLVDRLDPDSSQESVALTIFIRGVPKGIDLKASEANALLNMIERDGLILDAARDSASLYDRVAADDLMWYMVLGPSCQYDQNVLLRSRLMAIRHHNPGSRIMVQPSETAKATVGHWRAVTSDLDITWLDPRPIHTPDSGETTIGAMLDAYLNSPHPAKYLIKIDLDARVHRPFRHMPRESVGIFGTLEHFTNSGASFGDFPNVQGGCYGMSRETAEKIRDSGALDCAELKANPGIWAEGIADWRGFPNRQITLEDGLIRWATKRMEMKPIPYEEIDSRFRRILGYEGDFAITHPHKRLGPGEFGNDARTPTRLRPPKLDDIFDQNWFSLWEGLRSEYHRIADWIASMLPATEALDLGCGAGYMLERFADLGLHVRGVDGSRHARDAAPLRIRDKIEVRDLRLPLHLGQFGLVICCDLAAHLPPSSAGPLMETIASHVGGHLFFTSAAPGQGGRHHLNERPNDYWIEAFATHGLMCDVEMTNRFRALSERTPLWWIPKTALIFRVMSRTCSVDDQKPNLSDLDQTGK